MEKDLGADRYFDGRKSKRTSRLRPGEAVEAFMILKAGARVTEQELIDFCRNRIAIYKAPRFVEFVDSLPRNPVGKIRKRELRAREQKITEPSSLASASESR
jgi:acyl-CoA synthetase (AMP-forming)/AMP-acid ligase II